VERWILNGRQNYLVTETAANNLVLWWIHF